MKNTILVLITMVLLTAGCTEKGVRLPIVSSGAFVEVSPSGAQTPEQRGAYLVSIMGCHDCHTPWKMGPAGPEPDMDLALSGHPEQIGPIPATPKLEGPWVWSGAGTNTAFAGPWGVSYTMNLTPDENTGIGIWTPELFIKTIRTGKHWGTSRPIAPPMPWTVYRNASDEDLKAIFAYLRTLKPITNHVPDYQPPDAAPATAGQ
jgi:mono/diheme cytochrome c family protein